MNIFKRNLQNILRCLFLLVPLFTTLACSSDPAGGGCTTSSDCATAGQICSDGACVACVESAACEADEVFSTQSLTQCREGLCTACAPGEVGCGCVEGACNAGECVADFCTDCRRGDIGCVCRLNGTCAVGASCGTDGLCGACTPGTEGCDCVEDQCDGGLTCADSVCVPDSCEVGGVDCPCGTGDVCDDGLYCDGTTVCRTCSVDVPGCPCTVEATCEGDNFCADSICEACPAVDKPVACGCTASAQCGEGLVCDATNLACREPTSCTQLGCLPNQLCTPTTDGDFAGDFVCVPETCVPGYVWDVANGACVATDDACLDDGGEPTRLGRVCLDQNQACVESTDGPTCVDTCQTLGCSLARRDCTPGAAIELDAICSACQPGYTDVDSVCELLPSGTCTGTTAGNISVACTARNRTCVEVAGGAFCGECVGGRAMNPRTVQCEDVTACGDSVCFGGEFCHYPQNGATPQCRQRCPSGHAINENGVCVPCGSVSCTGPMHGALVEGQCVCESETFCADIFDGTGSRCRTTTCGPGEAASMDGGVCTSCNVTCGNDPGEGARVWPWRDPFGQCFCETLDDYYRPLGVNALPAICDADGDGWISESAELAFDAATLGVGGTSDEATLANFRCARRTVDRVQLVNEYGQSRLVGLCGDAIVDWAPSDSVTSACPSGLTTVALFENDDLDQDSVIGLNDTSYPPLGMRKLFAADLNATTKACVSLEGDFNANGIEDLTEAQPRERADLPGQSVSNEDVLFGAVAHFVELHSSRYVAPGAGSGPGRYRVEERSRCSADFPLGYEVGRDSYWTACERRRRADYDATEADGRLGGDFGQFGCTSLDGACPLRAPVSTGMSLDTDTVVDHDVCALGAAGLLPLADEPWRGMNHHSQFQCSRIADGGGRERVSANALSGGAATAEFDFNVCQAVTCGGQAGCVEATAQSDVTNQPDVPNIDCAYRSGAEVVADTIGFVSKRFSAPGGVYDRGCIDESVGTIASVVTATSAEIGRGYSRVCAGFAANPTGLLTAPNRGDFGKLICACGENYVGESCEQACPTRAGTGFTKLHTGGDVSGLSARERADYACSATGYCSLTPPDAATGFTGGRKGFWMCGEATASRGAPEGLSAPGSLNGQSGTLTIQGFVPAVPVVRIPMATPTTGCSGGGCFVDAAGNVRSVTVF
ncbi:MAG: hypothetical protein RMA76_09485 [Deltaproteobacteria bacterium]|jgi:hypothetical protein